MTGNLLPSVFFLSKSLWLIDQKKHLKLRAGNGLMVSSIC